MAQQTASSLARSVHEPRPAVKCRHCHKFRMGGKERGEEKRERESFKAENAKARGL